MQDAYMGIDPGANGSIAILSYPTRTSAPAVVSAFKLKDQTERDIWDHVNEALQSTDFEIIKCYLENVSASPQMGVVSAFTFGCGKGFLLGILTASGMPYELVTPSVWEGALKCRSKGKKIVTRKKAQQLYSKCGFKITDAVADGLLIATYCARKERGLA